MRLGGGREWTEKHIREIARQEIGGGSADLTLNDLVDGIVNKAYFHLDDGGKDSVMRISDIAMVGSRFCVVLDFSIHTAWVLNGRTVDIYDSTIFMYYKYDEHTRKVSGSITSYPAAGSIGYHRDEKNNLVFDDIGRANGTRPATASISALINMSYAEVLHWSKNGVFKPTYKGLSPFVVTRPSRGIIRLTASDSLKAQVEASPAEYIKVRTANRIIV